MEQEREKDYVEKKKKRDLMMLAAGFRSIQNGDGRNNGRQERIGKRINSVIHSVSESTRRAQFEDK